MDSSLGSSHVDRRARQLDLPASCVIRLFAAGRSSLRPSCGLSKRLASETVNRGQSDFVAAVKERGFVEQVGRIRLGQLDGRRVGRIVHRRADRRIAAVAPQRREVVLCQRVVEICPMSWYLLLIAVVDAHNVFTDIGRLRNRRRCIASVVEVRFRECACVQLKHRVLIDQVGGNDVCPMERFSGVRPCRCNASGNDWRDRIHWNLAAGRACSARSCPDVGKLFARMAFATEGALP